MYKNPRGRGGHAPAADAHDAEIKIISRFSAYWKVVCYKIVAVVFLLDKLNNFHLNFEF